MVGSGPLLLTVHHHRDQVTPDVYPDGVRRSPARWLADRLTARLGSIESFDGGRTFYGAREAAHPGRLTGTRSQTPGAVIGGGNVFGDALAASRLRQAPVGLKTLTAAAHAHGFTEQQLTDADTLAPRHPAGGGHDGRRPAPTHPMNPGTGARQRVEAGQPPDPPASRDHHGTPARGDTSTPGGNRMPTDTTPAGTSGPQQVTLPPSLMRAVTLLAADPQAPPIAALEAAILITFGYALYLRQDCIDPWQVAIPNEQWTAICQALLDVPTRSGLAGINLGLDWVNQGPAGHDGPPAAPASSPVEHWSDVEQYPVVDWQQAIAAGATRLGYAQWVAAMRGIRHAASPATQR